MIKHNAWKQPTPQLQLIALVSALEGNISNIQDGYVTMEDVSVNINQYIEEIKLLNRWMSDSWT